MTKRRSIQVSLGLLACSAVGCATTGTRPHDMSAAAHREAAEGAEAHSARLAADPEAEPTLIPCDEGSEICWSDSRNPTEEALQEAKRLRALAAKHRAAARQLEEVEARRCAGIAERDRDLSPFAHRGDIRSVQEVERVDYEHAEDPQIEARGIEVVFHAVPGLTTEWLRRHIACHQARAAVFGFEMEGMEYCPLNLRNVHTRVKSVGNGFAVRVMSSDDGVAEEVRRRGAALLPGQDATAAAD